MSAMRGSVADALAAATIEPEREKSAPITEHLSDTAANQSPDVPALHTFRGDAANAVQKGGFSLAGIALSQGRKHEEGEPEEQVGARWRRITIRTIEIVIGICLIVSAIFGIATVYQKFAPLPANAPAQALFISVDQTQAVVVTPQETGAELMRALVAQKNTNQISLGLIAALDLEESSATSSQETPITMQTFFSLMAPDAPSTLTLALAPQFLLGLHSFGGNQPFLILKTDSYEQAYAGMLSWEDSMQNDLLPLFSYTPEATIGEQPATSSTATSTAISTTTSAVSNSQILATPFTDDIVDNHSARVIEDAQGNILFLWTFVDQNTIVITTNADTLQEIISRNTNAATLTIPSGN
jgi:hypothetical protein